MGIGIARWRGAEPRARVDSLPSIFEQRTGLALDLRWLPPPFVGRPGTQLCSLSVSALRERSFISLAVIDATQDPAWNVEGEFDNPIHPYLWHHLQASMLVVGLQAVGLGSGHYVPDQKVPESWAPRWSDLPLGQRLRYSRPWLWPIWKVGQW